MTDESLIDALPDLVLLVRRDGVVLRELGGRRLGLPARGQLVGRNLTEVWPENVAALLLQMTHRALRDRTTVDGQFSSNDRRYEVRILPHARERVLCMLRDALDSDIPGEREGVRGGDRAAGDRRALFAQLSQSIAVACLRERRIAVCMLHLQGARELGGILDFEFVEQIVATHLRAVSDAFVGGVTGYAGRLGDNVLLAVIENFPDREALREVANRLLTLLTRPVALGDATFTVAPSAGLAVLGEDGSDARQLLEHARSAMLEARRNGAATVHFYSDSIRFRSLARLDLRQELHEAIAADRLALRYALRHSLDSGRLVAVQAYLRWPHPVRGEVAAAEFMPIAESTGLAISLSRWMLTRLQRDLPALRTASIAGTKFSFGPLRQHLSSELLAADVAAFLQSGILAPSDFELRISERTIAGLADGGAVLRPLVDLGVAITVDEFGRGFTSLPRLARLPLRALQLDRRLVIASVTDPVARKAAGAALAVAAALELVPMAAGVDGESQKRLLQSLGCAEGLGDAFGVLSLEASEDADRRRERVTALRVI